MRKILPMKSDKPAKRDSGATRARILDAAKRAFSQTGYSHTGVREIANMAGTSSTLVLRYYGSKIGLFEAALRDAMPVDKLAALPLALVAEELATALPDRSDSARALMMIAMASGAPEAAHVAARVFAECSIEPIGALLGEPDGRVRSLEISILLIGFVFFLKHLPLTVFSEAEVEQIGNWFSRSVMDVVNPRSGAA